LLICSHIIEIYKEPFLQPRELYIVMYLNIIMWVPVNTAPRTLWLRMEETASRYGG